MTTPLYRTRLNIPGCHSGGAPQVRTRNPVEHRACGLDSGFALSARPGMTKAYIMPRQISMISASPTSRGLVARRPADAALGDRRHLADVTPTAPSRGGAARRTIIPSMRSAKVLDRLQVEHPEEVGEVADHHRRVEAQERRQEEGAREAVRT